MKRSPLQRKTELHRGQVLARKDGIARKTEARRKGGISSASKAQREAVAGESCLVCGDSPCDPAHLVSRAQGGDNSKLAVVPLCRRCHRAFDDGRLSIHEHLIPRYADELAYAVKLLNGDLVTLLQRLTGERWRPESHKEAA